MDAALSTMYSFDKTIGLSVVSFLLCEVLQRGRINEVGLALIDVGAAQKMLI